MGTERIPEKYIHACDGCGAAVETASRDRPVQWTALIWVHGAHFQGVPGGNGTVHHVFCATCSTKVADAINATGAKP